MTGDISTVLLPVGHFLLTYLLSDLIKRSTPARIINVSSMAHRWGTINLEDINSEKSYDKQKAYSQSKLANILFTRSLAKTLEGESNLNFLLILRLLIVLIKSDLFKHNFVLFVFI